MIWGHLASSIGDSSLSSPSRFPLRMGMSASTFMSPNRHVPRLAFAPVPVELPTKSNQGGQKAVWMDAFVSKSCPSLYQPYDPPRWMHKYDLVCFQRLIDKPRFFDSGHIQTAYCVVGDFTKVDKVVYHR